MPPIIEDYAAIKRRMDEIANGPKPRPWRVVIPVLEGYGPDGPVFGQRAIIENGSALSDEGREFMRQHGVPE